MRDNIRGLPLEMQQKVTCQLAFDNPFLLGVQLFAYLPKLSTK